MACLIEQGNYRVIIVNIYIPPATSQYAPPGLGGYEGVLWEIYEWVTAAHLAYPSILGTYLAGDFNAHLVS